MCGIAAVVRFDGQPVEQRLLEQMTASLVHRGPDEGCVQVSGAIGLGFRRLSILDLSHAASQPMASGDGDMVLIFNGEIFNYVELREELKSLGHRFRSTGDTEVLLRAYQEWGGDCLPKLNGMWAFLIHDRRRNVLFGARDRFGIKPLYRYRRGPMLLLASEIKAIRASGAYVGAVDWSSAASFLRDGRLDEGVESFYEGITQVAAFGDLFEDSVRLRMRSDVPVGVSLSGGLDSSSIICAAARQAGRVGEAWRKPLLAFSYVCPEYDETPYIESVVKDTGAYLKHLETSPYILWERLPEVLRCQDEPVHSLNAVVGYELMRVAASHGIRVVLNGQGADETIGGYFSYFMDYWRELLWRGRIGRTWGEIQDYSITHGGSAAKLLLRVAEDTSRRLLGRIAPYRYFADSGRRRKLHKDAWFVPDLVSRVSATSTREVGLSRVLKRSVTISPLPLYLRVEDRNSMAHSIETRLPFLDYRLVSLVFNLSSEWKVRGGENKFLLREAMRQRIPELVRRRKDKMGFPTPFRKWLAGELYGPVHELIASREARERGIYNTRVILKDLEAHRRGEETDIADRLLGVAQFELWTRMMKEHFAA